MSWLFVFAFAALGRILTCQCFHLPSNQKIQTLNLSKSTKIINGVVADIQDFPYVVSLQYNGTFFGHDYDHFCCGSILNENWIITSAQCVQARTVKDFHIRVGSSEYFENGVTYDIEDILIHPNFNEISRDYDTALIKLSRKITFNANINPISLPNESEIIQDDTNFSIVGWGAYQLLGKISDDLLYGQVQKISDARCKDIYGIDSITNRMFCVFSEGSGPCVGDSGSPAVFNNTIIGVASWSYGCAYTNPTVYSKTSSVLSWIKSSTKIVG